MLYRGLIAALPLFLLQAQHAFAAGKKDGEYPEVSGLPQLDVSTYPSQLFWLLIVFVVMYFIFSMRSLPAVANTIEKRSERINNDLDSAERLKDEVSSVQKSYEDSLTEARNESAKMFHDIEKEIKDKTEQFSKDFQEHSIEQINGLEESIAKTRAKAIKDMSDVAAEVASEAAAKIIGIEPDKGSAKAVVDALNKAA